MTRTPVSRWLVVVSLLACAPPGVQAWRALVTGASGFLGQELCHQLDAAPGCEHVTAIVRGTEKGEVEDPRLACLPARCAVAKCDLASPDGAREVRALLDQSRADVCFNIAAPFTTDFADAEEELVRPALAAANNVAVACLAATSVRRLVHTSSMAAVRAASQPPSNGQHYTTDDWNTVSKRDGPGMEPYQFAKTESERLIAALFADAPTDAGTDLVMLCPSMIFGPARMAGSKAVSFNIVRQWLQGARRIESRLVVDVRDVAAAHVAAATCQLTDQNRFILSCEARTSADEVRAVIEWEAGGDFELEVDADFTPAIPIGAREVDAAAATATLGVGFRSPTETIADMVRQLREEEPTAESR